MGYSDRLLKSPIDQNDIEGYRRLRAELGLTLAHHIGQPDPVDALYSEVCDYFILGTQVAALVSDAHIANARGKQFWMQSTSTYHSPVHVTPGRRHAQRHARSCGYQSLA